LLANNAELDGHPLLPVRIRMLIPPLNPNGLMRQQQAIQCVSIGISADVSEVAMGEMYAPSDSRRRTDSDCRISRGERERE